MSGPTERQVALARGLAEGLDNAVSDLLHARLIEAQVREITPKVLALALRKKSTDGITKQLRKLKDGGNPLQLRNLAVLAVLAPKTLWAVLDEIGDMLALDWIPRIESPDPGQLLHSVLKAGSAAGDFSGSACRSAMDGDIDSDETEILEARAEQMEHEAKAVRAALKARREQIQLRARRSATAKAARGPVVILRS